MTEQIDAGASLANDFSACGIPLVAAFWLKEAAEGQWYLYLASDRIDDSNITDGYRNVHRILGGGPHLWLDPWQVKVAGIDEPSVRAIIELQRKYPGNLTTRLRNLMLGDLNAEEVYLYPLPIPAANA